MFCTQRDAEYSVRVGIASSGGGCFLTRRHGGAEKHAENMFGLASVLGTQGSGSV